MGSKSWLSSNWPIALGWVCLGLFSILSARPLLLCAAQMGVGVAYAADEIAVRTAPSKTRVFLIRVFAGAVLLAMAVLWGSLLGRGPAKPRGAGTLPAALPLMAAPASEARPGL